MPIISNDANNSYIPRTLSPYYSTWEIEKQLSTIEGFASHFAGIKYYNPETINLFRILLNRYSTKLYKQVTMKTNLLEAKAKELQKFIANHITKLEEKGSSSNQTSNENSALPVLSRLKILNQSISECLVDNNLDAAWLLSAYMSVATSISDPAACCEEEIDFLQHFINPKVNLRDYYDYDLINKVGRWTALDALMHLDLPYYQKKQFIILNMHYSVLYKIIAAIRAALPMPLYYPKVKQIDADNSDNSFVPIINQYNLAQNVKAKESVEKNKSDLNVATNRPRL